MFHDIKRKQLARLRRKYRTTSNLDELASTCEVLFVCVPTESMPNGDCDTSILKSVLRQLKKFEGMIVQVSTVPPGTGRQMSKQTVASYVVVPSLFSMARMEYDALYPVRIMIGTKDGTPNELATQIYSSLGGPIYYGTYEMIELAKYADNALSGCLISYWNEIYEIARRLKVDSDRIARMIETGPHYRSVYRWHGKAYGGPCLPKDIWALRNWAMKSLHYYPQLIDAIHQINTRTRRKYGVSTRPYVYRP
jgi:UDPglucose 6-dehydrogenase